MTTLLLIRHAANDTIGKRIAGRMPGVHLNREGLLQAERLAERLAGIPVAAIYASPLERTRETAEPIARKLGHQVQISEALAEIDYGEWTGRALEELADLPRWKRYNSFRSGTRAPQGELMLEAQARTVLELERLRRLHPEEAIAVVTHGDIVKGAIAHYAGIPLDLFHRIEISCASITVLALHEQGARILQVNNTGEVL
jgi:probable phosphoglycerate mutase